MNRIRHRAKKKEVGGQAAISLFETLNRFVYDKFIDNNERLEFSQIDIRSFALESNINEPYTALHRCLKELAFYEFCTYLYDDLDWVDEPRDLKNYFIEIFSDMRLTIPNEFNFITIDNMYEIRDRHRNSFIGGLDHIVSSTFAMAWRSQMLMRVFNMKLATQVRSAKYEDFPAVLSADGKMKRASYWPKWLEQLLLNRHAGRCYYCPKVVASSALVSSDYDIDHVVPIAQGGTNDPTNLVIACKECNGDKGADLISVADSFHWPPTTPF
jgi:hypothetical protein